MTKISQWVTAMASKTPGSTVSLVGQGSFLDKPSLHMVGYMGKNNHSSSAPNDGWCPVCKTKGQTQALKTYRINFTQSIFLCTNPQCIYPLGYTPLDNIIADTADLKKSISPNKQKKHHVSDLSPTPVPVQKRPKIDLPIFGDSPTVQTDLCKFLPGFPTPECETSSPTRLQHGQKESTVSQMQSISGITDSFSSSALWDKSSYPILPTGSPSRYAPGQLDGLPAVQNGHQEVLHNGELEEMDTLNNGSLLPLPPETDLIANKVDKVQEKVKQGLETEMTECLNKEHVINGHAFGLDHVPSYVSLPTPLLQSSQQECQVKENSFKEMSVPLNDTIPDLEFGLPQSCEFIKDNLCLVEPPMLQHEQPKEQMEQMGNLTDEGHVEASSCNNEAPVLIQDSHIEISENAVRSELQHAESDQQITVSSLLEISPPTCPEPAVQALSDSLQLMQGSFEMPSASHSLEGVLQECTAEGHSLWKPVSSPPCLVAEDSKKSQSRLPSCDLEECQPESLSNDDSDMPLGLTSVVPDGSVVSAEDPSIQNPNLSLLQELVQNCQKTNSEEHNPSNFYQDILPESHVEEKALKNTSDSPTTSPPSVKDQADATAISLPGSQLSKRFDTAQACPKNDMATVADSLQDNPPDCHPDDGSLEEVPEPHANSASIMMDNINAHRNAKSLNKMSLPGPQILLQDCLKCHCGINTQNLWNTQTLVTNSVSEVGSPLSEVRDITDCEKVSAQGDAKLPGPQILLQDCLKCHCVMNIPSQSLRNTKTMDKNSSSEVSSSLRGVQAVTDCEEVSPQTDSRKDSNTNDAAAENTIAAPPIEYESEQKKKFYENTILPDLLLDIQPEHRMEEPLSAAPSPACDGTVSMTISDMEETKQDVWQNGQVKESDDAMETEATEIVSDHVQDGSKLSDTLETSLNSEGLADESNEAMEANDESPAQVDKGPAAKKLKPAEKHLQWKNKHSLCWLDCILSALVHSQNVSRFVAEGHHISKESVIHNLFTRYEEATALFKKSLMKRKTEKDHKRPKYEKCLNEVRMVIFEKLKPLLKCKLGKKESPVFALPLLLRLDPETEKLFAHSFVWQFKCEACGYSYQQRCQKTLTTFTKVLPEWHPLNAVHIGPCNQCQNAAQKRIMVLEKLNSVFMVHFVEGLPSSDLNKYSFQFQGHSYEVKTIIKYRNEHFSTWMSNRDGTWLESDDLRGAFCRRYQKIRIRADDIHIVIWERSDGKTIEKNVQLGAAGQDSELYSPDISMASQDQRFSSEGTAEFSEAVPSPVPPVALDASNPLAGMECYADDDIITLTLVEIPLDVNGRPVETLTELQPTSTCPPQMEANQGRGTHTAQSEIMANVPIERQEDSTLKSPICSDSNAETVPIRNCNVTLSPLKESPLKPVGEAIAASTPIQQPYNAKKSVVGNWMTRLINKDHSVLNMDPRVANKKLLTLKTCPPLKVTDSCDAPKKAQNFNAFQGRSRSKTSVLASKIFPTDTASNKPFFSAPKEVPVAKPLPTPTASGFRVPGVSGLDYGKLLSKKGSSSNEDKIRKLRLKLLKKLKAKKYELATLEKMADKQGSDQANGVNQGGFNRKEHLRSFLKELQEQIDNADNESVCTMSSSASICSSPGDAEFFTELFSPSPVNQTNDSSYLEMLADGCGIAAAGSLQQANDHQLSKEWGGALPSSSCPTTGTLNSSTKDESLNLMSNSTLAVLNEDNGYFDFDEYF